MSEYDVVVLALGSLLVIILFENRIPLPNHSGHLEQSVPEIFGTSFRRDAMPSLVLSGLIHSAVDTAERNKAVSRVKAAYVTDLAGDQSGSCIADAGDTEKIRTDFIDVTLYLSVVVVNSPLDMFEFFNGVQQFKSIAVRLQSNRVSCSLNQLICSAFASAMEQRCHLGGMGFGEFLSRTVSLENGQSRFTVNIAEQCFEFRENKLNEVVYGQVCFSKVLYDIKSLSG